MNKTYTKKQITEAIGFWKSKLEELNESDNMTSDIMKTLNEKYDIDEALDSFAQSIEDDLKKTGVDVDEVIFKVNDDFSKVQLFLSYVVKCHFQPPESQTRWDPGTAGYIEDVYPKLSIELLNKKFNDCGMSIILAEKCASNNTCAKDAMKTGENFDEFFTEYLTDNFFDDWYEDHKLNGFFHDPKDGSEMLSFIADVTFDVSVNDFATFGNFLLPFEKKQSANESQLNEMNDQDTSNIQISLVDGMWKAQSLETGYVFFGSGKFNTVLQQVIKKYPDAIIWANVDGEATQIWIP